MALALGVGFMAAVTIVVIATRDLIPLAFLGDQAAAAPDTVALASALLLLGATFFVFDGVQTIGAGALRGLHDTRIPLVFAAIGFWMVGFSSAYLLGFPLGFGAYGIWIGLTIGLFVYASLLIWRFHRLTARGHLPSLPATEPELVAAPDLPQFRTAAE
jgi:MATE family multidrug resistance protein